MKIRLVGLLFAAVAAILAKEGCDLSSYKSHIASAHLQAYKQGTLHMVKSLDLVDMKPLNANGMSDIFKKMELNRP